jgi:hypothetical protein
MSDSMAETVSNLPAVRPTTQPIPVITEDTPAPAVHYTYPALTPQALDEEWHDTGGGEAWRLGPHNQQVYRALEHIIGGLARVVRPDIEITRRAAVILLSAPTGATPFRCPQCQRHYTAAPVPADWAVAGREDLPCRLCTLATPAAKTIVVTPEQARKTRRRPTTRRQP